MRIARATGRTIVTLILIIVAMSGSRPTAASDGSAWQTPIKVTFNRQQFVDYRTLRMTGDAVYYQLTVSTPTTIRIALNVARSAPATFAPQLVVFQPNEQTIGPLLPVIQPPQTIATVYPLTPSRTTFDVSTQTLSEVRLEAQPDFPTAGQYIFAVYNAGSAEGRYRLTFHSDGADIVWHDIWSWPGRWWQDQTFAEFSYLTLIAPTLLGLAIWLVYLRLDHHQLHVHKTYSKSTVKKGKQ